MAEREKKYGKKKTERRRIATWVWFIPLLILVFAGGYCANKMLDRTGTGAAAQEASAQTTAEESTMAEVTVEETMTAMETTAEETMTEATTEEETTEEVTEPPAPELPPSEEVYWSDDWTYAENSKVHQESILLYHAESAVRNGITVCVNAGHGSSAAQQVKTLCHPDGSEKVTGGSTASGATKATGANSGTDLKDGTSENRANLELAMILKEMLLEKGYDVLMIREDTDCDLDNIARTLYANNYADCHLALHYDSTNNDKGFFYIGVPDISSYRNMEPVASHWEEHEALGKAIVEGMRSEGVKIYDNGRMALDLTQTSYSTVPSLDVEVGDRGSDHGEETLRQKSRGIIAGLDSYFGVDRSADTDTVETEELLPEETEPEE